MIVKKLDKRATLSAFAHYMGMGLIIPFVNWDMAPWLKGIVIALVTAVPVMVVVYPHDKKAWIPMLVFSIVLGAAIGVAGAMFIG